jgi:microcystin-dependent protein
MDCYIGLIFAFAGNFAPMNFMLCAGQTLQISQYQALFAVIGALYGGNGSSNFMLPNLCARFPVGADSGRTIALGKAGGAVQQAIGINNLPSHTHVATFTPSGSPTVNASLFGSPNVGSSTDPAGNFIANVSDSGGGTDAIYAPKASAGTPAAIGGLSVSVSGNFGGSVANALTGSSVPLSIMPPYQAINYIICVNGLYPMQS